MNNAAGEPENLQHQLRQALVEQNAALASVEELLALQDDEELLQVGFLTEVIR